MITPPYLKAGDKVAIVAPARKILPSELDFAVALLQDWGLNIVMGNHLFGVHNQYSGTDDERLEDLQQMMDDPSVRAVFCARGGYGTIRIIDRINFSAFQENPKWLIGFSDITTLHSHINHKLGVETLHAAMPFTFPTASAEALESLRKAVFGETLNHTCNSHPMNREGTATGILTGGNLSIIYALNATPSDIDTSGKILFIEDLDEYLYHIDRMMLNLKRSGKLENLAGLVVGGMTEMKDNTVAFGKKAEEIIRDAIHEYHYPVCFGFPAGHFPDNRALIMGREVTLSVTRESASMVFKTGETKLLPGFSWKKFLKALGFVAAFFLMIYLIYSLLVIVSGR